MKPKYYLLGRPVTESRTWHPVIIPGELLPGDLICLLQGARVPIFLRPVTPKARVDSEINGYFNGKEQIQMPIEHFQLIGECFVEGAMFSHGPRNCQRGLYGEKKIFTHYTLVRVVGYYYQHVQKHFTSKPTKPQTSYISHL